MINNAVPFFLLLDGFSWSCAHSHDSEAFLYNSKKEKACHLMWVFSKWSVFLQGNGYSQYVVTKVSRNLFFFQICWLLQFCCLQQKANRVLKKWPRVRWVKLRSVLKSQHLNIQTVNDCDCCWPLYSSRMPITVWEQSIASDISCNVGLNDGKIT